MTVERTKLTQALQMNCAGHPVQTVLNALCDTLANVVAFASDDCQAAEALVDALGPDLKRTIAENWDYVASVKLASVGQAGLA